MTVTRRRKAEARMASSSRSPSALRMVPPSHRRAPPGDDLRTPVGWRCTPRLRPERAGDARAICQASDAQHPAVLVRREVGARVADFAERSVAVHERQRRAPGALAGTDALDRLVRPVTVEEGALQHRDELVLAGMRR